MSRATPSLSFASPARRLGTSALQRDWVHEACPNANTQHSAPAAPTASGQHKPALGEPGQTTGRSGPAPKAPTLTAAPPWDVPWDVPAKTPLQAQADCAHGQTKPLPTGLPKRVAAALCAADRLQRAPRHTLGTGFAALDAALPGGGWPCQALTEVLSPQAALLEWRLLGPLLQQVVAQGHSVFLVGPPQPPHLPGLPGLLAHGQAHPQLVWVQAHTQAERLWACEQLLKANTGGTVLVWLAQARPEHMRRLQVLAGGHAGPLLALRPSAAAQSPSAAPLRLLAHTGPDWALHIELLKRPGPPLAHGLRLHAIPNGLQHVLPRRLLNPMNLPSPQSPLNSLNPSHGAAAPQPKPANRASAPATAGQPRPAALC